MTILDVLGGDIKKLPKDAENIEYEHCFRFKTVCDENKKHAPNSTL